MTIKQFVEEFKNKKVQNTHAAPNAVEKYLKETLNVKEYISFADKRELCRGVLDASCTQTNGVVEMDSVSRYILFTVAMLTTYTDLEFGNDDDLDTIDEYDLLCQSGLLNSVIGVIGDEYGVCNNLLNMMMADIDANNNNMAVVIGRAADRLLNIIDGFATVLSGKVEEMNLDLSQIDIEKYKGILEKFNK